MRDKVAIRERGLLLAHRVTGGCPPPVPTEPGVRISHTGLFGS